MLTGSSQRCRMCGMDIPPSQAIRMGLKIDSNRVVSRKVSEERIKTLSPSQRGYDNWKPAQKIDHVEDDDVIEFKKDRDKSIT